MSDETLIVSIAALVAADLEPAAKLDAVTQLLTLRTGSSQSNPQPTPQLSKARPSPTRPVTVEPDSEGPLEPYVSRQMAQSLVIKTFKDSGKPMTAEDVEAATGLPYRKIEGVLFNTPDYELIADGPPRVWALKSAAKTTSGKPAKPGIVKLTALDQLDQLFEEAMTGTGEDE